MASRLNQMKSESLEEARDRLAEQSQLERDGFAAASEGQLIAERSNTDGEPEEDSPRAQLLAAHGDLRVAPTVQDMSDEDSVNWTRSTMENGPDAQLEGDAAPRAAKRRGGSKSQGKGSEAKALRERERAERKAQRDADKAAREANKPSEPDGE